MQIITLVNQKGGVGKTTTTVNLAAALAAVGKKTLIIDLDPQGNASTGLGISNESRKQNIYHLLFDLAKCEDVILKTNIKKLDIIPATVDLAASELELKDTIRREYKLKQIIESLTGQYQYILIDSPPSLGLLTLNALCAANNIIIPMQSEFYSLEGLSHLLKTYKIIQANFNSDLDILGVVLTMYDSRNRLSEAVKREIKKFLGEKLFHTVIPRNIKLSEAPSHGMPAIAYDHTCLGSKAYIKLAKEILIREAQLCKKIPA